MGRVSLLLLPPVRGKSSLLVEGGGTASPGIAVPVGDLCGLGGLVSRGRKDIASVFSSEP